MTGYEGSYDYFREWRKGKSYGDVHKRVYSEPEEPPTEHWRREGLSLLDQQQRGTGLSGKPLRQLFFPVRAQ